MTLIARYLSREILAALLAVLLVLVLVGISNQFVIYLADAAAGEISAGLIFKVLAMHLPSLIGILLPLAIFLSVVLTLSRWYADAELVSLFACGFTRAQLVKCIMIPATAVTLLCFLINVWVAPHYLYRVTQLLAQAQTDLIARAIQPGRFQLSDDGRYVLYINRVSEDGTEAFDIFVAEQEAQDEKFYLGVISSPRGARFQDATTGDQYIVVEQGHRYQGVPGEKNYQLMAFREYGLRILDRNPKLSIKERALPSKDLLKSEDRDEQAELQWRICLSLSALVLPLWAIIIAKTAPRQGRYARAFPAILTAIIYVNVLIFAKSLYEDSSIPQWIGIYWVPVLAVIIALALFQWQSAFRNFSKGWPWLKS